MALAYAAVWLLVAIAASTFGMYLVRVSYRSFAAASEGLAFRGILMIVALGVPLGAYSIVTARKGVLNLLDATRGTSWRWESDRGGPSMFAIARDGDVKWIEGEAHFRVGKDVSGAEVSTGEVFRLGLRDLARALDEDPRDLLVLAAFAGMITRSELRVGRTLYRKWAHDKAAVEVPGWDVRAMAPPLAASDPIERAIMVGLPPVSSAAKSSVAPYRGLAPEAQPELDLAATPLKDVWNAAWLAAGAHHEDDHQRQEGDDERYVALRERLRSWLANEPAFHAAVVELCDERRVGPRRPKVAVSDGEPRPG